LVALSPGGVILHTVLRTVSKSPERKEEIIEDPWQDSTNHHTKYRVLDLVKLELRGRSPSPANTM
jgi:hypothetical protein